MKLINYFKETKGELKHVSWPTRKQATAYTLLVVMVSVIVAVYVGVFDYLFSLVVKFLF